MRCQRFTHERHKRHLQGLARARLGSSETVKRRLGALLAALAMTATVLIGVVAVPGRAFGGISSDKAQISQLEQEIMAKGAAVQAIVTRYNQVASENTTLEARIAGEQAQLASDRKAELAATNELRRAAINAYTTDSGAASATLLIFTGSSTASTSLAQSEYLNLSSAALEVALSRWKADQSRTQATEASLHAEQLRSSTLLRQLSADRTSAQAAVAADEALLNQAKGSLAQAIAAANARNQAAQQAAENAAAAGSAGQNPPPPPPSGPPPPPVVTTPPSGPAPAGYSNPLSSISGLYAERIDQGVDYSGSGPIYAIGDGTVLSTTNSGWPTGTFITYQLSNGAAKGLIVYVAEDVLASVQVGQSVTPTTVLGQMYLGGDGIETGWAAPGSPPGEALAGADGQFSGSNSTAFGYNFSQLLQSLGAPGGVLQNNPPTGSLPAGWPTW